MSNATPRPQPFSSPLTAGMVRVWNLTAQEGDSYTLEQWPDGTIWVFSWDAGAWNIDLAEANQEFGRFSGQTYTDIVARAPVPCVPIVVPAIGTARLVLLDEYRGYEPSVDSLWMIEVISPNGDISLVRLSGGLLWPEVDLYGFQLTKDPQPTYSYPDEMPWHVWRMFQGLRWRSVVIGSTHFQPLQHST